MGDTVDALTYKADVPSRARDKVANTKDRMVGTVTGAKDRIMGSAGDTGGRMMDGMRESTPDRQQMRQGARQAVSVAESNPLGLAVGAAAVGFIAGMMIPSTRVEDERLGAMSDQVKSAATDVGGEALERGKQVAQETAQTAMDTARQSSQEHGQDLAQTAAQRAQETVRS